MATTERGTTLEQRDAQLRRSIVRVLDRGGRVVGTGFFVAAELIVTCAHVVREALLDDGQLPPIEGGERIEIRLSGDLPDGQEPIAATVERELFRDEDAEDVAFLRLEPRDGERLRTLLGEVRPLGLANSQGLEGANLRGFAFPRARPSGLLVTATVVGPLVGSREGRRLQVSSTDISLGCSGAPLWDERGRVIGMAVSIIVQDPTGRHSNTAFMIAAEVLAGAYPELTIERVDRNAAPTQTPAPPQRLVDRDECLRTSEESPPAPLGSSVDNRGSPPIRDHNLSPYGTDTETSSDYEHRVRRALRHLDTDELDALHGRRYQRAIDASFHRIRDQAGITLVVGDAGQGKTNWSATSALAESRSSPTVWLRSCFIRRDGLDAAIVRAALGSDEPGSGSRLSSFLRRDRRVMLVFIDAIDEYDDYALLLRIIQEFLTQSNLAPRCHLILTCRTEAVHTFEDIDSRILRTRGSESRCLYLKALEESESEQFLLRHGATRAEVAELRRVLPRKLYGNPLYLKLARRLQVGGALPAGHSRWIASFAQHYEEDIKKRLHANGSHPDPVTVRDALGEIAYRVLRDPRGIEPRSIQHPLASSDTEGDATFMARATHCGLLVRSGGRVRFCHALLCEHYAAHYIVQNAELTPTQKVDDISRLPGRDSLAALAVTIMPPLLQHFALQQPALLPPFDANSLDEEIKEQLIIRAASLLNSQYPSERHAGVRILSTIRTSSATRAAVDWFNGLEGSGRIKHRCEAAELFLNLELPSALHVVLHHNALLQHPEHVFYEPKFAKTLEGLPSSLKQRLADYAVEKLGTTEPHSPGEATLITALAYTRDSRLLPHLRTKALQGPLSVAEHRALIHLNTDGAMEVYLTSIKHYYEKLDALDPDRDEHELQRLQIQHRITPNQSDIARFPHDALVQLAERELQSPNRSDIDFGLTLATRFPRSSLADSYARIIELRRSQGWIMSRDLMIHDLVQTMDESELISFYHKVQTTAAKADILRAAGHIPGPKVEEILLNALDDEELFAAACVGLRRLHPQSAGAKVLARLPTTKGVDRRVAIELLGLMRYAPALDALLALLKQVSEPERYRDSLVGAVGLIGGKRAYDAIAEFYRATRGTIALMVLVDSPDPDARTVAHGLLHGFPEIKYDLALSISGAWSLYGDVRYQTEHERPDLDDDVLLQALLESAEHHIHEPSTKLGTGLSLDCEAIARFDSPRATAFLEDLACRDPRTEPKHVSREIPWARRVLGRRGNATWARTVVEEILDRLGSRSWMTVHDGDRLCEWPQDIVREALLPRVREDPGKWLQIFSQFATREDEPFIRARLAEVEPDVADIVRRSIPS